MFIWPDGDVTGAEQWDELARLVGERPDESGYFPAGVPTEAGWARLEVRLSEHLERIKPPEPDAPEEPSEASIDEEPVDPEPPRRGPGRPRKEA